MVRAIGIVLLLVTTPLTGATFRARVERIMDGDSFVARDVTGKRVEIRLSAIDAPEGAQQFGDTSRAALQKLIGGREMLVAVDDVDKFGRFVSRVSVGSTDVNLAQLQAGMAWVYPRAENVPGLVRDRYAAAEREAKRSRRGLWAVSSPQPPWEYRHEHPRSEVASAAGPVVANRRSRLYHLRHCPGYGAMSAGSRVVFATPAEAEKAGYRRASNCR